MEKLLEPQLGLVIWTIVTFLLLVLVLRLAAWKPILKGLSDREGKIRGDLERAEKAQQDAEILRQQYQVQLGEAEKKIQDMIRQARQEGERSRADLLNAARAESDRILDKGRKDLTDEAERLKSDLRHEVASLSLTIAEKVLRRSVDRKLQEEVLKDSLQKIEEVRP